MLVLMNSAMCPQEGVYRVKQITEDEAKLIFEKFKTHGWVSYVGYHETARYMSRVLGEEIPVSRAKTQLQPNDMILVCKLGYRVDPEKKGQAVNHEDFEWWLIHYEG